MNAVVAETQALLSLIVSGMVKDRDAVQVKALTGPGARVTFDVKVGGNEIGKLIGAQGRVARSIRTILMSIGKEQGIEFALELDNSLGRLDHL